MGLVIGITYYFVGGRFSSDDRGIVVIESDTFSDVVFIPNPDVDELFMYLVFPFGEAKNPNQEGLLHYVEHLAWLSVYGDTDGHKHSNAWTNKFSVGYWQSSNFDDFLKDLRTLIKVAQPLSIDQKFALEERDIVLREYDYRVAERPLYPIMQEAGRTLYGTRGLGRSVIGRPSEISKFALKDAETLHRQSHDLSRATLLIYGNITAKRLESLLSNLETTPNETKEAHPIDLVEDGQISDTDTVTVENISEDVFLYTKLIPWNADIGHVKRKLLLKLAENALDSAMPEGLAGPLRFEQFITRSFSFDLGLVGKNHVKLQFTATPDNGVSLDDIEHVFHTTLNATLRGGLSIETFERVKSRLQSRRISILERDRPAYNRDLVLSQIVQDYPIYTLADEIEILDGIERREVNEILRHLATDARDVSRKIIRKGD